MIGKGDIQGNARFLFIPHREVREETGRFIPGDHRDVLRRPRYRDEKKPLLLAVILSLRLDGQVGLPGGLDHLLSVEFHDLLLTSHSDDIVEHERFRIGSGVGECIRVDPGNDHYRVFETLRFMHGLDDDGIFIRHPVDLVSRIVIHVRFYHFDHIGYGHERRTMCLGYHGHYGLGIVVVETVELEYGGYEVCDPPPFLAEFVPQSFDILRYVVGTGLFVVCDHPLDLVQRIVHIGQDRPYPPRVAVVVHVPQPCQEQFPLPGGHDLHVPLEEDGDPVFLAFQEDVLTDLCGPAQDRDVRVTGRSRRYLPGGRVFFIYRISAAVHIVLDPADDLLRFVQTRSALDRLERGHVLGGAVFGIDEGYVGRVAYYILATAFCTQGMERIVYDELGTAVAGLQRQALHITYVVAYAYGVFVEMIAKRPHPLLESCDVLYADESESVYPLFPIPDNA